MVYQLVRPGTRVTKIQPSPSSLRTARRHARSSTGKCLANDEAEISTGSWLSRHLGINRAAWISVAPGRSEIRLLNHRCRTAGGVLTWHHGMRWAAERSRGFNTESSQPPGRCSTYSRRSRQACRAVLAGPFGPGAGRIALSASNRYSSQSPARWCLGRSRSIFDELFFSGQHPCSVLF